MATYVALLRGINVGGNNRLPMASFRELLSDAGCGAVATYIQSGNAVFRYDGDVGCLRDHVADAIKKDFGFRPSVVLIAAADFVQVVDDNPYADVVVDPKHLVVWFCEPTADDPDSESIRELAAVDESYTVSSSVFYLHAPSGTGRSKLASKVERCLGVPSTARNWRTVLKLEAMLADLN